MANIVYKSIKTNGEYVDMEEALGITFAENTAYQIQILNTATIMIADSKPTEGGFFIFNNEPFGYLHKGSKLWIKTTESRPAVINISEG